jgi:hypothetical protein
VIQRRAFLKLLAATAATRVLGAPPHPDAATRGRAFLADLLDAELGLLPEFRGSKTYWLWHDNYLAAKTLAASHPDVARIIHDAIAREGIRDTDGKTEMLFGATGRVLPFRQYDLKIVRNAGEKIIRTEVATERLMTGWENYADLLFLASIAEENTPAARMRWDAAMRMWDGKGFADAAFHTHKIYATYKLALALIAACRLSPKAEPPPALMERLLSVQAESGGWITDYRADGKPLGLANVETSCFAILAIESTSK